MFSIVIVACAAPIPATVLDMILDRLTVAEADPVPDTELLTELGSKISMVAVAVEDPEPDAKEDINF